MSVTVNVGGTAKAAVIGGGVIGAGWAARFALHGWDVALYDPEPETPRKAAEVLENARRSLPAVLDSALPTEGDMTFPDSLAGAVNGAQWVQESVPERLELKHQILVEIQSHADDAAIIASSTSGFMPSELQQGTARPGAILVAHPYNPVYLLPLVELVAAPATDAETTTKAGQILESIGMKVLRVAKEIPAHIGDRLLEAVWREGLWLVKDGIATTQEIDDCIAYGFGLRWAQMGLFETFRAAGGEAGMANFIAQFGPALKWPWTKLMDVPELDADLVGKIAEQSDAQSGEFSIRELERIRDENIVGFLRVLKDRDWGAGHLLRLHDARLSANSDPKTPELIPDPEPYQLLELQVLPSWIDYNGHMTEFRYLQVFGDTSDALLARVGLNAEYLASKRSYYTVETHIMHIDEAKLGEGLHSTCQILAMDEKRLHVFHRIHAQGGSENRGARIIATAEQMLLHVDQATRRASSADPELLARLIPLAEAHKDLPWPEAAGRHVGRR